LHYDLAAFFDLAFDFVETGVAAASAERSEEMT
jgi:hypothetical protein